MNGEYNCSYCDRPLMPQEYEEVEVDGQQMRICRECIDGVW